MASHDKPRPFGRLVPALLSLDRVTSVVDVGLAVTANVLGAVLGVLTAVLLVCWRITTPRSAPPLAASVLPIGEQDPTP